MSIPPPQGDFPLYSQTDSFTFIFSLRRDLARHLGMCSENFERACLARDSPLDESAGFLPFLFWSYFILRSLSLSSPIGPFWAFPSPILVTQTGLEILLYQRSLAFRGSFFPIRDQTSPPPFSFNGRLGAGLSPESLDFSSLFVAR